MDCYGRCEPRRSEHISTKTYEAQKSLKVLCTIPLETECCVALEDISGTQPVTKQESSEMSLGFVYRESLSEE